MLVAIIEKTLMMATPSRHQGVQWRIDVDYIDLF
tara:strand:- start:812 stop:913 length:102 start_codon:yes stop_codon:yes gene_type:complete